MSRIQEFRKHALTNLMEIEHVLTDIYSKVAEGLDDFTCFDGGAHKGHHTLRLAKLAGCREVIAVEADPKMATFMRDLISRQGTSLAEITLVEAALQRDPNVTSISWQSSSSHEGRSSIISSNAEMPTIWTNNDEMEYREVSSVNATTIDKILTHVIGPLPFLKLDLEGADLAALFGARDTLVGRRPIVAFENSTHALAVHGFTLDEVIGYYHGVGYVPMNFAGEPLTRSNWFEFFEAWAVPRERAGWLSQQLSLALQSRGF